MKQYLLLFAAITLSVAGIAQGNSGGKGKGKMKTKEGKETKAKIKKGDDINNAVWEGTQYSAGSKPSKNQPAKVRSAFGRDYPNAGNVVWSKYRGDWTATFNSAWGRSTAIYHANGDRRDTRTPIYRNQLPTGTVWDRIFKRDGINTVGNIIQIEAPSLGSEIFRIAAQVAGSQLQYLFYNRNGERVQYNY